MTNSAAGLAGAFVVVVAAPSVELEAGAGNAGILSLATGVLGSTLGAGRCTNKGITCCGMAGGSAAGDATGISMIRGCDKAVVSTPEELLLAATVGVVAATSAGPLLTSDVLGAHPNHKLAASKTKTPIAVSAPSGRMTRRFDWREPPIKLSLVAALGLSADGSRRGKPNGGGNGSTVPALASGLACHINCEVGASILACTVLMFDSVVRFSPSASWESHGNLSLDAWPNGCPQARQNRAGALLDAWQFEQICVIPTLKNAEARQVRWFDHRNKPPSVR